MGRIDICCEVSVLSSCLAMPRQGHLQQALHIFAYLKRHHNSRIIMDPTYPDISTEDFPKYDWTDHYDVAKDDLPSNAPTPLGKEFVIRAFVDADHAGDVITRRSRSGFIIIVNSAPIYWLSKNQNLVECSSFGSELIAMKLCCEYIQALRYKIRMMGIPMTHNAFVYGDNQSVLWNTSCPDSILRKKHYGCYYHYIREGCASETWRTSYCTTKWNPSDILTKCTPAGEDRYRKVRFVMYDIYPIKDQ